MTESYEEFIVPPLAPTFRPTSEEWSRGPAYYLNKIRTQGEYYGICKIIPPPDWTPSFNMELYEKTFVPRVQRPYELNPIFRCRELFYTKIRSFWFDKGFRLKIPSFNQNQLDLYNLYHVVRKSGGFIPYCPSDEYWRDVSDTLLNQSDMAEKICEIYADLLHPFCEPDMFDKATLLQSPYLEELNQEQIDENSKNLEKIRQIRGNIYGKENFVSIENIAFLTSLPPVKLCCSCNKKFSVKQTESVKCSFCSKSIHKRCSSVVFDSVQHVRVCLECLSKGGFKEEAYGFNDSRRQYKLSEFAEFAAEFKRKYFGENYSEIPKNEIEKEFWRIMMSEGSRKEDMITVEYGTDLHVADFGSGFPSNVPPFSDSPWNLNKLGIIDSSALSIFTESMSGVRIPWCYVGMCFSCFCWHVEDHWSYSINYQHWGDIKTWYGVGRRHADKFEAVMAEILPELFDQSRDLLNHLTTLLNPTIMMAHGIDVYKIDQRPGEIVVTFPRGYHGGFNQGLNFNEAVNYCPADWMPIGRDCIKHNANLGRDCVFSHDELVCRLAMEKNISPDFSLVCSADLQLIKDIDVNVHRKCEEMGIKSMKLTYFELLPDSERICSECRTLCFLWSFSCTCQNKMNCYDHLDKLCTCEPANYTLNYRYKMTDFGEMTKNVDENISRFAIWKDKIEPFIHGNCSEMNLDEIDRIHREGLECGFYKAVDQLLWKNTVEKKLSNSREVLQKLSMIFDTTLNKPFQILYSQVEQLNLKAVCVKNKYAEKFEDMITNVKLLRQELDHVISSDTIDILKVDQLLRFDIPFDKISLPEYHMLKSLLNQYKWLQKSHDILQNRISIEQIVEFIEKEKSQKKHKSVKTRIDDLNELVSFARGLDQQARAALQNGKFTVNELEKMVGEELFHPLWLPYVIRARKVIEDANAWVIAFKEVMNGNLSYPFDILEELYRLGSSLPVALEEMAVLESCVKENREWKSKACHFFLKKNSNESLLSVLWPSTPDGDTLADFNSVYTIDTKIEWADLRNISSLARDSEKLFDVYKHSKKMELEAMKTQRMMNLEKRNHHRLKPSQFCICQKSPNNQMLLCCICNDLFHENCASSSLRQGYASIRVSVHQNRRDKFVCMKCSRTRRPKLMNVINLLVGLQRSTLKVPEGELLQCMTEVMMSWQKRVIKILAHDSLAEVLKKGITQANSPPYAQFGQISAFNADLVLAEDKSVSQQVGRRTQRKTQLVPRQFENQSNELNQYDLSCLEELMVEGDLYQIDSDEAEKLWEVIVLSRGIETFFFPDQEVEPRPAIKRDGATKGRPRGRKRRFPEEVAPRKPRKTKNKRMNESDGVYAVNSGTESFEAEYYSYEDVACHSLNCMYPVGPVDWLTCANCRGRFHKICVPNNNIDYMCDYYCTTCLEEFDNLKPTPGLFGDDLIKEFQVSTTNTPSGVCLYTMEDDDFDAKVEKSSICLRNSDLPFS